MPYTYGDGEIDVEAIDLAIGVDEELTSPPGRPSVTSQPRSGWVSPPLSKMGRRSRWVSVRFPMRCWPPLAVSAGSAVWSEAISDGVLELEHAGALDERRPIVTTFLFGSPELYSWVDRNPRVRVLRTETVNDPSTIASHPMMCSINTALQVDLYAQANASFVRGADLFRLRRTARFRRRGTTLRGGHAVIALPSWHAKSNTSTIVPRLTEPATSFQHSAVVTEQGQALLFGRSQRAQARLLIENIAHPEAKAALWDSLRSHSAAQ